MARKKDQVITAQTQVVGHDFNRHAGKDEKAPFVTRRVRIVGALNETTGDERFSSARKSRVTLDELPKTDMADAMKFDKGKAELALTTARKRGASTVYVPTDQRGDSTARIPQRPESFHLGDTPANIAKRSHKSA